MSNRFVMSRIALICALGVPFQLAAETSAPASYVAKMLTPAQAAADIALLRRALETIHPGLYRYRTHAEIDAAFAELETSATHPLSDLDLYRAISIMLANIHCDHTKAEASATMDAYRQTQKTHLPLRFSLIEGRMIVVSNDGQPGAPPPGSEITAINGVPTPTMLTTLGHAVAYDGATDQAIAFKLSDDSDLTGDDFDEYYPAFYGFPKDWRLDWKPVGVAETRHAALSPIAFDAWTRLVWSGAAYRDEFYKSIRWRIAGKTALLRTDTFVNYRNPVDATAFLGGFFKTLKDGGVDHLILDLRKSGGGSEDVSVALGRYLLPERFVWSKPVRLKTISYGDLPDHMESWGDRKALFEPSPDRFVHTKDGWWDRKPRADNPDDESTLPQDVSPDRFAGRLTILTGPANGSGATRTVAQLKERAHATLIGDDTSGSAEGPTAGYIFLMTLPNSGLKVRVPNAWNRTNIERFTPKLGVAADKLVVQTLFDTAAGRDRVLDIAKAPSTPVSRASIALKSALSGSWTGGLDYRDFRSDKRVVLPTLMSVHDETDGDTLSFTFDDGPGKTVRSSERWAIDEDTGTLAITSSQSTDQFKIREIDTPAAERVTLVMDGDGRENDVKVRVRLVVTREGSELRISRLTAKPGEPLVLRDGYDLAKAAQPSL